VIQKDIVNLLSKKIIGGEIDKTKPVMIDVFDGVVVVRNEG
jgi:ATP-dependent Clp protease ATP-binding subunit ClpB